MLLCWPDGTPAYTGGRSDRWIVDFTKPAAVQWWGDRLAGLLITERPDAFADEIPEHAMCHDGRTGLRVRNACGRLYQAASARALRNLLQPGRVRIATCPTASG